MIVLARRWHTYNNKYWKQHVEKVQCESKKLYPHPNESQCKAKTFCQHANKTQCKIKKLYWHRERVKCKANVCVSTQIWHSVTKLKSFIHTENGWNVQKNVCVSMQKGCFGNRKFVYAHTKDNAHSKIFETYVEML